MRTEFQVGDRLELVIEKLPTYPGQTYICNGVEVPVGILKAAPRRVSQFPLEVGDTIVPEGKPDGAVTAINDDGIHLIFVDGTTGLIKPYIDVAYVPSEYTAHYVMERVRKIAEADTDKEEDAETNGPGSDRTAV